MRVPFLLLAASLALSLAASAAARQAHPAEPHGHADAAKLKNPVPADDRSLAAGKALYAENCAECHGDAGAGDGPMGGDPPPANFTDAEWKHGSSDGEIFTVIRDGVDGTDMDGFDGRLEATQMWHLVNYLRTLAPEAGAR